MVFISNGLQLKIKNVESDIRRYYCYTSINIGREEDVIIEWDERKDMEWFF